MTSLSPQLEPVSIDLVAAAAKSDDFTDWNPDRIQRAAERYRRFFLLASKAEGPVAPTRDIDAMWHLHMLHPRVYYLDCMQVHGEIFDHDGGFGKGEGELPVLQATFERTAQLWQEEYGEEYGPAVEGVTKCWHDCQGRCWHACSKRQ